MGLPSGKVLVWDLPIRLFHWGFAGSFSLSLVLGTFYHPEGIIFKYHMISGIMAVVFLGMRLTLGFVGSRHNRWLHYFVSPVGLFRYLAATLRGRPSGKEVHNPATVCVAWLMYLSLVGLIWTGFNPDLGEVWHKRFSNAFTVLIIAHLSGLLLHTVRHRDGIALAMISGNKIGHPDDALTHSSRLVGWLLLLSSVIIATLLMVYFDADSSRLEIPGLPTLDFPEIQKG